MERKPKIYKYNLVIEVGDEIIHHLCNARYEVEQLILDNPNRRIALYEVNDKSNQVFSNN